MSITWGAVREWDADGLEDAAHGIKCRVEELDRIADELNWANPRGWQGDAADQARASRLRLVRRFDDLSHETDPVKRELQNAADEVIELHRAQTDTEDLAGRYGMTITADGALTNPDVPPEMPAQEAEAKTRVKQRLHTDIARILDQARLVDAELAAALRRAADDTQYPDANGNRSRLNPPPGGDPKEVHDWWLGLSKAEQDELIATNPSFVGNTDGIPADARDQANRSQLADQRAGLESDRARLQAEMSEIPNRRENNRKISNLLRKIDAINAKLSGIEAIETRLAKGDAATDDSDKYYLLQIDQSGDGQAIVAKGNPDTADNVTTYIPGTGAELAKIGGDLDRGDRMQSAAEWSDLSKTTSVITYLGYDAPDGLPNAMHQSYAHDAKHDLDSFQNGLRATHDGPPSNNTVLGHSYGNVVAGIAAHDEGLAVDNMVMIAPPGGVYDHASDLGVDNVYVTIAEKDPVDNQPFHGPYADTDEYGADVFTSDPGTSTSTAHSEYWDRNNLALENMGHIIAGNPDKATRP